MPQVSENESSPELRVRELAGKVAEPMGWYYWLTSALVVAVFSTVGDVLGNFIVAYYNANRADESLATKAGFDQTLEREKSERASVVEMLKLQPDEKVTEGLRRLLDLGARQTRHANTFDIRRLIPSQRLLGRVPRYMQHMQIVGSGSSFRPPRS